MLRRAAPLLALSAALCQAQGPLGAVAGVVVDAASGEGVPRASIRLFPREGGVTYSSTTDLEGNFRLDRLAPGLYGLVVEAPGFLRFHGDGRSGEGPASVRVLAGGVAGDLRVALARYGVISGVVEDELGRPLPGAKVAANRRLERDGRPELGPGQSVQTDDEGRFRIANLTPGRYLVYADLSDTSTGSGGERRPPPDDPEGETLDLAYLPTFYPNALEAQYATPIDVRQADWINGLRIRLELHRTLNVDARLTGPHVDRQAWPDIDLMADSPAPGRFTNRSTVAPDGRVRYDGLRPGGYTLVAKQERDGRWFGAISRLELTDRSVETDLWLQPGVLVTARVLLDDPDWAVEDLRIHASLSVETPAGDAYSAQLEGGRFGNLSTEKVVPGSYRVFAQGYPTERGRMEVFYLEELRQEGSPAPDGVVIDQNPERNDLTLTLARAAVLHGRVVTDRLAPAGGVDVLLFSDGDPNGVAETPGVQRTDPNGEFFFRGLIPGKRRFVAVEGFDAEATTQDGLRRLRRLAEPVEIEKAGDGWLDLELTPAERWRR